jgi:hypothetical protein
MKCYLNGENVVRKDIRDDHAEYTKNNTVIYTKNTTFAHTKYDTSKYTKYDADSTCDYPEKIAEHYHGNTI